ncbi:hypothetical protein LIER_28922 [Lithospermum erythrorhizon]|uniref:Uncharacterized protein n=1 Tax=Lithospermum erythrorhizon TaxID=34254 RepID=A0AAV3RIG2_LITER
MLGRIMVRGNAVEDFYYKFPKTGGHKMVEWQLMSVAQIVTHDQVLKIVDSTGELLAKRMKIQYEKDCKGTQLIKWLIKYLSKFS